MVGIVQRGVAAERLGRIAHGAGVDRRGHRRRAGVQDQALGRDAAVGAVGKRGGQKGEPRQDFRRGLPRDHHRHPEKPRRGRKRVRQVRLQDRAFAGDRGSFPEAHGKEPFAHRDDLRLRPDNIAAFLGVIDPEIHRIVGRRRIGEGGTGRVQGLALVIDGGRGTADRHRLSGHAGGHRCSQEQNPGEEATKSIHRKSGGREGARSG